MNRTYTRQTGVTLVELLVTMAITLFLVAAAAYVYLSTRETQRAIDNNSSNTEVGTFALQLIGEQIMMAGYYPATTSRVLTPDETFPKISGYPPTAIAGNAANSASDWVPPAVTLPTPPDIYKSGIFGCDNGSFFPAFGKCETTSDFVGDSIMINYFTNDNLGSNAGHRMDCTGSNVDIDPSNVNRRNTANPDGPPTQPLFVSNRFAVRKTNTQIEKQAVVTFSLACNGNGVPAPTNGYQPLLAGIEDLQITYGVFAAIKDEKSRTAQRFYTATELNNDLKTIAVDTGVGSESVVMSPWARISAVRVCVMVKSQSAGVALNRSYTDCDGVARTATDTSLHKRFVQVFVVRNKMNQVY